ncbi:hypothetical protein, partial [Bizionia paragorgiae]
FDRLVVALLLASDFPAENPRVQNRNVPYTKPLAVIKQSLLEFNNPVGFLNSINISLVRE